MDSKQSKTSTSHLKTGYSLRYKNEGHNEIMDLTDINANDPAIKNHSINVLSGNTKLVTREFIKPKNEPNIS